MAPKKTNPSPGAPGGGQRPAPLPKAPPKAPAPVQSVATKPPAPGSRIGWKGPQGVGYRPSATGTSASVASADTSSDAGYSGGDSGFDAEQARRQTNSIAILRGLLSDYGLDSLLNSVIGYVQDGYDPDAIMVLIRQTPEYKDRFPAMAALAAKKRTISEAAYIEYERNAANLERMYGMPAGLLGRDTVTSLLSNDVSAAELEDRVTKAAAAAYTAAPEVRQALKNFYGIDSGGLTSYFLDPQRSMPLLNKQFVSAQMGAEAAQQGIGIDVGLAETLASRGVTTQEAGQGFQNVASMAGLSSGAGEQVSQSQLIQGNLLQSAEAQEQIGRVQKGRTGRFEAGGGFTGTSSGVSGLASSST